MVKYFPACFTLVCFLMASARADEVPPYRLGEVATNDVFTVTRLLVVDEEATAALREKEAAKIDDFVVYSTNHAAFIQNKIARAIASMREEFLWVLKANFGTDHLVPEVIEGQRFEDIVNQFLAVNPGPPIPRDLPALWAAGQGEDGFLEEWCDPLQKVLSVPVRPDSLPAGIREEENRRINLVGVGDLQKFVKEEFALSNSVRYSSADLVPLNTARKQLSVAYLQSSPAVVSFMINQLEPNCRWDTNLTQRVKNLCISRLVQMKQFEPGEVVIHEGQTIDKQALATLTEVRDHAKVEALEKQVAVNEVSVKLLNERNLWLVGLLGSSLGVLIVVMVRSYRKRHRELLPVLGTTMIHPGAAEDDLNEATVVDALPDEEGQWRRRALEAEQRAERAAFMARSKLMPHVAQQLKDNVVQQMASQMDSLIEVQAAVAEQMSALEARLDRIHAPLEERLHLYETRISDLEKELTQRGTENQILLRARIEALKKQMELEKSMADADAHSSRRPS